MIESVDEQGGAKVVTELSQHVQVFFVTLPGWRSGKIEEGHRGGGKLRFDQVVDPLRRDQKIFILSLKSYCVVK